MSQLNQPISRLSGPDSKSHPSQDIADLERWAVGLAGERANIFRQLNERRSSTRKIPAEILSNIFQLACYPSDDPAGPFFHDSQHLEPNSSKRESSEPDLGQGSITYVPLILVAVSSVWREVAFSTPRLWNTLLLRVHNLNRDNKLALMRLFFDNARHVPLSLELEFGQESQALCEPFETIIFLEKAEEITDIRLIGVPEHWITLVKSLSVCEHIAFGWRSQESSYCPTLFSLTGIGSRCRKLTLRGLKGVALPLRPQPVGVSWLQITILNVERLPSNLCISFLNRLPNLIEFRNRHSKESYPDLMIPRPYTSVSLDQLKYLEWNSLDDGWNHWFFKQFRFEKLQEMILTGFTLHMGSLVDEAMETAFRSFFGKLPTTLIKLQMNNRMDYDRDFSVMDNIPQLEELVIGGCRIGEFQELVERLREPVKGHLSGAKKFLPRLRLVTIQGLDPLDWGRSDGGEACLDMAEIIRRDTPPTIFRVVLDDKVSWRPEVRAKLVEMVHGGLQLEIIEKCVRLELKD